MYMQWNGMVKNFWKCAENFAQVQYSNPNPNPIPGGGRNHLVGAWLMKMRGKLGRGRYPNPDPNPTPIPGGRHV
jgi:hypothetical protein